MEKLNIRIGNIECRFSQNRYEIVKWEINPYYRSEDRLVSEGYEKVEYPDGSFSFKKEYHNINESCFKNPESCYTISTLEFDEKEYCCELRSVGNRLLKLKKQDRKDFFKVYKIAEREIVRINK